MSQLNQNQKYLNFESDLCNDRLFDSNRKEMENDMLDNLD